MKRSVSGLAVGALLLGLPLVHGATATAQDAPEGFKPVSIYSLDGGSVEDSIGDPALVTKAGVVYGNPTTTADRNGNENGALLFDGVDDYVETNEDSNINPLTFSAWFRADDIKGEHSIIDSDVSGKYGQSLILGYKDPRGGAAEARDGAIDVQYHDSFWDTGYTIEPEVWTQVFVSYGADEIKVYVVTEGQPVKLAASTKFDSSKPLDGTNFRFGRHNVSDPQWFKGALDDVRFYDKALTQEEITEVVAETTTVPEVVPTTAPAPETTVPVGPPPTPGGSTVPSTWGDVHITTPDRLRYDFQTFGDFMLSDGGDGVKLQARQSKLERGKVNVSYNTGAAMQVGKDKLEFYTDAAGKASFFVNDQATDLPTGTMALPGGGSIEPYSDRDFTVIWADGKTGARVLFQGSYLDIGIGRLSGDLTYEGVLGNLDGDPSNDMKIRGGDVVTQPSTPENFKAFGESWILKEDENLFNDPVPVADAMVPDEPTTVEDLDQAEVEAAKTACTDAGVTEADAHESCTYDMAASGGDTFTASALTYQNAVLALAEADQETFSTAETVPEGPQGSAAPAPGAKETAEDDKDGMSPIVYIGGGILLLLVIAGLVLATKKKGDEDKK